MSRYLKRCWANINLEALDHNLQHIRSLLPMETEVMAVVKANAYGHGDSVIARELEAQGIRWFCVSNIDEAISLRKSGIKGSILILGTTPVELCRLLVHYHIIQTVYSLEYAELLNEAAASVGGKVECHLKIDTGMGRIGFIHHDGYDALEELLTVCSLPCLNPTGIFTHYSVADEISDSSVRYTASQLDAFCDIVEKLKLNGITFETIHTRNSGGIEHLKDEPFGFVRAGIILYGLNPSGEVTDQDLRPVMELKTSVSMVKTIHKGASVSYGRRYIASGEAVIATVPVGYADGFPRSLAGRAEFLVRGKRAKIVGTVCMDQLMLDVTDIPDVKMGDEVTIFGKDGDNFIGADDLAAMNSTVAYEIVCAVGHRVPRVYYKGGKVTEVVNYLYDENEAESAELKFAVE